MKQVLRICVSNFQNKVEMLFNVFYLVNTWHALGFTVFLLLDTDSCHGRVIGINNICFLCSSYCRSQATTV